MPRAIAALIRHGEYHQLPDTPSAHQPYPLTPAGADEVARAAAEFAMLLRERSWSPADSIHSSSMQRAWQTATIFADALRATPASPRLRCESFEALSERGVGCAANLSIAEIERILEQDERFERPPPGWKSDSHYRLPLQGAESLMQAGQRVAAHLQTRMQRVAGQITVDTVQLFVGHGAAFRHAASELGLIRFDQLARLSMYHARPVLIEFLPNGQWRHIGGDWKIRERQEASD